MSTPASSVGTTALCLFVALVTVTLVLVLYLQKQSDMLRLQADHMLVRGYAYGQLNKPLPGVSVAIIPENDVLVPDSLEKPALRVCAEGEGFVGRAFVAPVGAGKCLIAWAHEQ